MLFKLFVKKIERALGGLSPARRIFLSFAGVIFIGSLLLSLPFVQASGSQATYFDHLFTTVSMVCVTGLSTQPVATTYNVWGQLICMLLIQIGGLGLMTFIGVFYIQGKQKLSLRSRETIQESFSYGETRSLKAFMRSIFLTTFLVEGLGAFLLSFRFIPEFGWGRGIFTSIFLAISAFCNAGFDNFGSSSLVAFQTDPLINLVIAGLIITGGLGFMVWFDLATQFDKKKRRLRFHTKLVLFLTAGILLFGTVSTLFTEWHNPGTIGNLSVPEKVLVSFFQTVSMRTAGFASIDYTQARPVTLFIYILQMFLGGAPGGTAGGLKITTLFVLLVFARSELLGLPHANVAQRTIEARTVQKSFSVFIIFLMTFLLGLMLLGITAEGTPRFIYLMFETISALATVGVTANLTPELGKLALSIIMVLMFIGRIGPLTLLVSLADYQPDKKDLIQYMKADISIG
ncbi:TrkH family potassium uptake protein [Streptococcus mitis]|uniref:TrkH family potassium uptake protein n=1 Tax=Streptococcus mitis TaxID=28037 RepID=UPI001CBFB2D6|nr:potassium transporter TrkG [Streptococcus mitis]MBZ2107629.1 TrkH family potassium uptake protein [Streptococcus mitis]MBZ2114891.1 TrkH family potassium uptake protein [Streptococcus mitis]